MKNECPERGLSCDRGSMLLEFVLAFPIILILCLSVIQVAQLWVTRHVIHYAAYCAARATLVCRPDEYESAAERAATQVLQWVVIGKRHGERDRRAAGWGRIPGSGAVARKTRVRIHSDDRWNVGVTVSLDTALVTPIVGTLMARAMNHGDDNDDDDDEDADAADRPWFVVNYRASHDAGRRDTVPFPHIRMTETVWLTKPHKTMVKTW